MRLMDFLDCWRESRNLYKFWEALFKALIVFYIRMSRYRYTMILLFTFFNIESMVGHAWRTQSI
jgi:hypothetical protein